MWRGNGSLMNKENEDHFFGLTYIYITPFKSIAKSYHSEEMRQVKNDEKPYHLTPIINEDVGKCMIIHFVYFSIKNYLNLELGLQMYHCPFYFPSNLTAPISSYRAVASAKFEPRQC